MEFDEVAAQVAGIPHIKPERARVLYDHVRETRPQAILELGTAHGASATYLAAALEANGEGHLVTVDSPEFAKHQPTAESLLAKTGLAHRVTIDRTYSTYTWFLKEEIERQSDSAGNCTPKYDFCFLDGGKNWTIEGLTVFLVEKLLRPGSWLCMDDLDWTYATWPGERHGWVPMSILSPAEAAEPHLRAVFRLLVQQHPAFGEFRVQDDSWGWARKTDTPARTLTLETTRPIGAAAYTALARVWRRRRKTYR